MGHAAELLYGFPESNELGHHPINLFGPLRLVLEVRLLVDGDPGSLGVREWLPAHGHTTGLLEAVFVDSKLL